MHASLPFLLLVRYWVQPMLYIREYPSQTRLKELFDYVDGHLVWKYRPRSDFKTPNGHGAFNKLCVGKVARTGKISGYWVTKINGSNYRTHRLIWIWNNGDLRPDQEIDHRDCDKTNYALLNLRLADRKSNTTNTSMQINNTSGIKGVSWDSSKNKWQVQIKKGDKRVTKRFSDKEVAAEFARKLREELHGEFHNHGD